MDCGGRAKRRHRFCCNVRRESKAVWPLRSATAVHIAQGCHSFLPPGNGAWLRPLVGARAWPWGLPKENFPVVRS